MSMTPADDTLVADQDRLAPAAGAEQQTQVERQIPDEPVFADYFGEAPPVQIDLPDGVSWVQIKRMTEGDRRIILNEQNKSVRVQKQTGDAIMRLASGDERRLLLQQSIVGWNLQKRDKGGVMQPIPCNQQRIGEFCTVAPVEITELIEKEIRKLNPWLLGEMSLEDMKKERDRLQEMIDTKELAEVGNDS